VVRIFPDGGSCLRLVTALAMETREEWQARCCLDMALERSRRAGTRSAV